jgi:hypothetical protein
MMRLSQGKKYQETIENSATEVENKLNIIKNRRVDMLMNVHFILSIR